MLKMAVISKKHKLIAHWDRTEGLNYLHFLGAKPFLNFDCRLLLIIKFIHLSWFYL